MTIYRACSYCVEGGTCMCGTNNDEAGKTALIVGIKHDAGKLRYDLIPPLPLEEVARVYTLGATKYSDRNWEKGLSYSRLFGSLMRHAWTWWRGEKDDKENKHHHLSSVIFCALGLLHYELNLEKFKGLDDRNVDFNKV